MILIERIPINLEFLFYSLTSSHVILLCVMQKYATDIHCISQNTMWT
jgi:hypothetical protein